MKSEKRGKPRMQFYDRWSMNANHFAGLMKMFGCVWACGFVSSVSANIAVALCCVELWCCVHNALNIITLHQFTRYAMRGDDIYEIIIACGKLHNIIIIWINLSIVCLFMFCDDVEVSHANHWIIFNIAHRHTHIFHADKRLKLKAICTWVQKMQCAFMRLR